MFELLAPLLATSIAAATLTLILIGARRLPEPAAPPSAVALMVLLGLIACGGGVLLLGLSG